MEIERKFIPASIPEEFLKINVIFWNRLMYKRVP